MPEPIIVFHFGEQTLGDPAAFRRVAGIVAEEAENRLLLVVSPMGTTRQALEKLVAAHARADGSANALLDQIKRRYFSLAQQLPGADRGLLETVNDLFVEIDWVLEDPPHPDLDFMHDQIVSVGGMLTARMLEAVLRGQGIPARWQDARDIIRTDNQYREGGVDRAETRRLATQQVGQPQPASRVVITPGGMGSTSENFTTTLGPRGSVFSAALLANSLHAKALTLWIKGDPAGLIPFRVHREEPAGRAWSYREAMTWASAADCPFDQRTLRELNQPGIPLLLRSTSHPAAPGIRIGGKNPART